MDQGERAKTFYSELGNVGLADNISDLRTQATLSHCRHFLGDTHDVLDLACGYGRVTVPLAADGYAMTGLDIEPSLLDAARRYAEQKDLDIPFIKGDMRKMPFSENTFDCMLCLWAAFNELTTQEDQIACLRETIRVLRPGGRALFEMINGERQEMQHELVLFGTGEEGRILQSPIEGTSIPINHYIHSRQTLLDCAARAGISDATATVEPLGDRNRLFLYIRKQEP